MGLFVYSMYTLRALFLVLPIFVEYTSFYLSEKKKKMCIKQRMACFSVISYVQSLACFSLLFLSIDHNFTPFICFVNEKPTPTARHLSQMSAKQTSGNIFVIGKKRLN